jgi:hypothetical protein
VVKALLRRDGSTNTEESGRKPALFLMSDEHAPGFFEELYDSFDVFTSQSLGAVDKVPALAAIATQDNYKL